MAKFDKLFLYLGDLRNVMQAARLNSPQVLDVLDEKDAKKQQEKAKAYAIDEAINAALTLVPIKAHNTFTVLPNKVAELLETSGYKTAQGLAGEYIVRLPQTTRELELYRQAKNLGEILRGLATGKALTWPWSIPAVEAGKTQMMEEVHNGEEVFPKEKSTLNYSKFYK